jgi:hypothetical protein
MNVAFNKITGLYYVLTNVAGQRSAGFSAETESEATLLDAAQLAVVRATYANVGSRKTYLSARRSATYSGRVQNDGKRTNTQWRRSQRCRRV